VHITQLRDSNVSDNDNDNEPTQLKGQVPLDVRTLFGVQEKQGLVQLTVGKTSIMLNADNAETLGTFLTKCAETARNETALFRVMQRRGMSRQQFTVLLQDIGEQLTAIMQGEQQEGDMTDDSNQPRLFVPPPRILRN
jgi:hypothetical protein